MVSNKYSRDYILEEQIDPKTGRISTVAVYRGESFAFTSGAEETGRAKRSFSLFTAVIVISWVTALSVNAPCGHVWYCNVPFVIMVFPLWFAVASCLRFVKCRGPLTREARDKTCRRYIISLTFLLVFSMFALAGSVSSVILYMIRHDGEFSPGNVVYPVAAAVIAGASAWMLARRSLLDTERVTDTDP